MKSVLQSLICNRLCETNSTLAPESKYLERNKPPGFSLFFSAFKKNMYQVSFSRKICINLHGGVTTLRRAVSGEKQNSFGNLEILPGIGRLEKVSGRDEIMSGHGTQFLFC